MICKICHKIIQGGSDMLIIHLKCFHSLEENYACMYENCSRKFGSFASLKKHSSHCFYKKPKIVTKTVEDVVDFDSAEFNDLNNTSSSDIEHEPSGETVDEQSIDHCILEFVGQLYNNSAIARNTVQKIVEQFLEVIENVKMLFEQNLKGNLPQQYHQPIDDCLDITVIDRLKTEYNRFEYLKESKFLTMPQSFPIGEIEDNRNVNGSTILTTKTCEGVVVPMRQVLQSFLELPKVYETITTFMEKELDVDKDNKLYSSIFSGSVWKDIQCRYQNKTVIPLHIYYDDFESGDPLSPTAGVHKVGGLYYSIAALPPKFSASLDNIFLAQFSYTSDRSEFGNRKVFGKIIEELKYLSSNGISITVDGEKHQVYFATVALLGDNLGLNSLLGFSESFSANYYCRFCRISKQDAQFQVSEIKELVRNLENYKIDLETLSRGVKEECVFNSIPDFEVTENRSCDPMHDFADGSSRYCMAKIIENLMDKKYFSLNQLNNRIKYFHYDSAVDKGNKPPVINIKHVRNGYIIMTAAQMSALVYYFGMIVGDLVPEEDDAWELYRTHFDIIDLISREVISESQICHLEQLIKSHNEQYIRLFGPLVVKEHLITHYPNILRKMGSVRNQSTIRFEAFHKLSKNYSRIVTTRRNIIYTLAVKLQLRFAYRVLSHKGLENSVEIGRVIGKWTENSIHLTVPAIDSAEHEISWVKINGVKYRPKYAILLGYTDDDDPIFGLISYVVITKKSDIFFVYQNCRTIGLNSHTKVYEVELPTDKSKNKLFPVHFEEFVKRYNVHISAKGQRIISSLHI